MSVAQPIGAPDAPVISVIVPIHNVAGFIGPCLQSLLDQSFTDFEAILVDDGSTDSSRAEALDLIAGDPRFVMIARPNGGLSAARNSGLALAQGGFIAFLDGDDRYHPQFLARMLAALQADGGDWVACGLAYVAPGQTSGPTHSALHSTPDLPASTPPIAYDLTDWRSVIDHFPSAWNKLYRRSLIADLRFDEGTYYEDHAFFWQAASRFTTLLHLPEPLYLQTQGRPGQITRDGGDRVFQQFSVLERLYDLQAPLTDRTFRDQAFAALSVRLIFERAAVITDATRRQRFAATARAFLAEYDIDWPPLTANLPDRSFALDLMGQVPLSVIVPSDGREAPLRATLWALSRQTLPGIEVIVVADGQVTADQLAALPKDSGLTGAVVLTADPLTDPQRNDAATRTAQARNRGLDAARGVFVVFLDAGDLLAPETTALWLAQMLRHDNADMGFSAFQVGWPPKPHDGLHDARPFAPTSTPAPVQMTGEAALAVHSLPSAKVFSRAFLQRHALRFAPHLLQTWAFTLQALTAAQTVLRFPGPGLLVGDDPSSRQFWRAAPPAADLLAAIHATEAALTGADLPPHWATRLTLRAAWEKLSFAAFATPAAKTAFRRAIRRAVAADLNAVPDVATLFDPYVAADFRDEVRLSPQDALDDPPAALAAL